MKQDICISYDSSNGTDILLIDRINYIYNNDDTKCQSNCQFSFYSMETKYINCSCSTIEKNNKIDKFTAKKLYQMFYDVLRYSNYDILKCFSIILDIANIFTNNIGNIIVIINIFCYLILVFIYSFKGIDPLKMKIKLNNNKTLEENNLNNKISQYHFMNFLNPPIRNSINLDLKNNKKNKKKSKNLLKIINQKKKNSSYSSKKYILEDSPIDKLDNIKEKIDVKTNENKMEITYYNKYDDYQLNELEYLEAIKYDKRSLIQIYFATLKREHLLIFTFFNCNDYNLIYIKLSRFILLIVGDMALNVFFFSDDSMHKLFLNYGKYDFLQQIPQIIYSTIFSQLIEVFLCFLSLTDKYIYQIKSYLKTDKKNEISNIIKCIRVKLLIFFLFTFILLILYWYIITVFCGVYRNTQIVFIKDSLLSLSISMIYPFFIYFFTSILRICSLRSSKKNLKCLYKLSEIFPFF